MIRAAMNVINLYQCEPGFQTEKRIFSYHYMLYVHGGRGRFQVGSTWHDASMGDLFYCPPYVDNTIEADEEDPFLLSGIEWTADSELPHEIPVRLNLQPYRFLQELVQKMVDEYAYGTMYSKELCGLLLDSLLLECMRLGRDPTKQRHDISRELLQYIRDNLDRPVGHAELERVFSYHRSSINRILIESTGLTLKHYQIDLRVKKAMELLKYSRKTMGEIAEECGYASSIFFSRQFKAKTGMTPSEFRRPERFGTSV